MRSWRNPVLVMLLCIFDESIGNTLSFGCDGDSGFLEDSSEVEDEPNSGLLHGQSSVYGWSLDRIRALERIEAQILKLSKQYNVPVYSPVYPSREENLKKVQRRERPIHCDKLYNEGTSVSGIYHVDVNGRNVTIYCQFEKNGMNWVVFQQRLDGSENFYRNWESYENGFGTMSVDGEFWLGLSLLNEITSMTHHTLRVDLEDFDGNWAHANYRIFYVRGPGTNYSIKVEQYSGNAGDGLSYHNGFSFSTRDRDNDFHYKNESCAVQHRGAWWYNSCYNSNLNGVYQRFGQTGDMRGIVWVPWRDRFYSLKTTRMKIRVL